MSHSWAGFYSVDGAKSHPVPCVKRRLSDRQVVTLVTRSRCFMHTWSWITRCNGHNALIVIATAHAPACCLMWNDCMLKEIRTNLDHIQGLLLSWTHALVNTHAIWAAGVRIQNQLPWLFFCRHVYVSTSSIFQSRQQRSLDSGDFLID